ncbi:MAG: metallophosphoesterase [Cytophagaceae bacterium]|jgi:beta-galactosidase|nr:metallophosphoesterase [Cytophagaceae bacterium]
MKKKRLLFIFLLMLIFSTPHIGAQQMPLVRFGLLSDIQYCNCDDYGTRFFSRTLARIDECVAHFNRQQVHFTINLGDFTEKNQSDLNAVLRPLTKLNHRSYNITGNHDHTDVVNTSRLYRRLGMEAPYYSFTFNNIVFVMLNTNDVASYRLLRGMKSRRALSQMLLQIKKDGRSNGYRWNGGIGKEQLQWLHAQLQSAEEAGQQVYLFSHHPLYPNGSFSALNDVEVLSVISNFTCVKAMFAGHYHAGVFAAFGTIPCITVEGMVETADTTAFAVVELYSNKFVVHGAGRVKSKEIYF